MHYLKHQHIHYKFTQHAHALRRSKTPRQSTPPRVRNSLAPVMLQSKSKRTTAIQAISCSDTRYTVKATCSLLHLVSKSASDTPRGPAHGASGPSPAPLEDGAERRQRLRARSKRGLRQAVLLEHLPPQPEFPEMSKSEKHRCKNGLHTRFSSTQM